MILYLVLSELGTAPICYTTIVELERTTKACHACFPELSKLFFFFFFKSVLLFPLNVGTVGSGRTKDGFQRVFELQHLGRIPAVVFPDHHACFLGDLADRFDEIGRDGGGRGAGLFDGPDLFDGVSNRVTEIGVSDQRLARFPVVEHDFLSVRGFDGRRCRTQIVIQLVAPNRIDLGSQEFVEECRSGVDGFFDFFLAARVNVLQDLEPIHRPVRLSLGLFGRVTEVHLQDLEKGNVQSPLPRGFSNECVQLFDLSRIHQQCQRVAGRFEATVRHGVEGSRNLRKDLEEFDIVGAGVGGSIGWNEFLPAAQLHDQAGGERRQQLFRGLLKGFLVVAVRGLCGCLFVEVLDGFPFDVVEKRHG